MYTTNNSLYDRSLEKTPEQLFINSLWKEYELSPAESAGILELAKSRLFSVSSSEDSSQSTIGARSWPGRSRKRSERIDARLVRSSRLRSCLGWMISPPSPPPAHFLSPRLNTPKRPSSRLLAELMSRKRPVDFCRSLELEILAIRKSSSSLREAHASASLGGTLPPPLPPTVSSSYH